MVDTVEAEHLQQFDTLDEEETEKVNETKPDGVEAFHPLDH